MPTRISTATSTVSPSPSPPSLVVPARLDLVANLDGLASGTIQVQTSSGSIPWSATVNSTQVLLTPSRDTAPSTMTVTVRGGIGGNGSALITFTYSGGKAPTILTWKPRPNPSRPSGE